MSRVLQLHLSEKTERTTIDNAMMAVSIVASLSAFSQIYAISSTQSAGGVSLLSWLLFAVFGVVVMVSALVHKIKPMIITQVPRLFMDILVVVGVVMYS